MILKILVSGISLNKDLKNSIMVKVMKMMAEMNKMSITINDMDAIKEIIKPLIGHKSWNVKLEVGSFLTMEFGDPIPAPHLKKHGEWHLWIYCCGWYLENPKGSFIGSEDPRDILRRKLLF